MNATTTETKPKRKKTKPTAAEAVAKMRQAQLEVPPIAEAPELLAVPLDLIDTADQVRTAFDDASIAELAADIKVRGVLQPVLLRKKADGRFLMIAGERRLRAARLLALSCIPALAGDVDDDTAADMQLAENIQREELNLADTAKAVRRLFDRLGSLQTVADRVHKSKPWVSKHLAATCPDFGYHARRLLDSGKCEDLEVLNSLSQVEKTGYYQLAHELAKLIETGKAGRETAREYVKKAKDQQKAAKAAKPAAPKAPPGPPPFNAWHALWKITEATAADDATSGSAILIAYDAGQRAQIYELLEPAHARGAANLGNMPYAVFAEAMIFGQVIDPHQEQHPLEFFAFLQGINAEDFDLARLLDKMIAAAKAYASRHNSQKEDKS